MSTTSHIEAFQGLVNSSAMSRCIKGNFHRSDLLPMLFKLRGQPLSLEDYPQFKVMYDDTYIPDLILLCGRQLGKSLSLSRSEVFDMLTVPHMQILYVAPLQKQTQRYSAVYLKEAVAACTLKPQKVDVTVDQDDVGIVQSIHHQTFANGSGIQLTYAKTSSDRARGIYADRIDFDEIQDQLVDNIPIISESMTSSNWGVRRFTGTAKTADNTIEYLWQQSAMCEWVMRCGCGFYNIPNADGNVLDMIQPTGVHCVKCGKRLNVRDGEFVAAHRDKLDLFRGYHIPQIVIPAIVENPQKWSRLIRKVLKLPVPTIMQEILGISCSEGSRLITKADIEKQSVLPTTKELQDGRNRYQMTIGGIDWGVAEQTSFTVHTILGITPQGEFHVIYAKRYSGFSPDETLRSIAQAHMFYGCKAVACDFGMGFDKNIMLEQRFGLAVVQINYCSQLKLMTYNPILGHTRWMLDKTAALEMMFMAIKYGRIKFPPVAEFEVYTDDLLALYEETHEGTNTEKRYFARNPNHPDDFAHALCFAAMTAMRMLNSEVADIVPGGAYGSNDIDYGAPDTHHIDPMDILGAGRL